MHHLERFMTYKDTLTIYEELVATGISDSEAKVQAHQFGSINVFILDVKQDLEKSLSEIRDELKSMKKDMLWMRLIGAALFAAMLALLYK